jgi:hypothetical protein
VLDAGTTLKTVNHDEYGCTQPVVEDPNAAKILQSQSLRPSMRRAALRGIADETTVYEIP